MQILIKKFWKGETIQTTADSKNKLIFSYLALTVIRTKEIMRMPARKLTKYLLCGRL